MNVLNVTVELFCDHSFVQPSGSGCVEIGRERSTHNFYHADGNGNITYLVNSSQGLAASYRYDPFGNTTASSGTPASANVYRFSSKEVHARSGMYYYLYRFYDPNLHRWLNRDPLGEQGGINLYAFVGNAPTFSVDPFGLEDFVMWPTNENHRRFDSKDPKVYDIGCHGSPSAVFDQNKNPLSASDLYRLVQSDPAFMQATKVKIWACGVGQGKNSFAEQFAKLCKKKTCGPTALFWESGKNGKIAPDADNDGWPDPNLCKQIFTWKWKTFQP